MSAAGESSIPRLLGHRLRQEDEILAHLAYSDGLSSDDQPELYIEFRVRYYNRMFQQQQQQSHDHDQYINRMVDFGKLGFFASIGLIEEIVRLHQRYLSSMELSIQYQEQLLIPAIRNYAVHIANDLLQVADDRSWVSMVVEIDILTTPEHENISRVWRGVSRGLPHWRKLPSGTYHLEKLRVAAEAEEDNVCAICLEKLTYTYIESPEICRLPCNHTYHWLCTVQWLYKSDSCPLCRQSST